MWPLVNIATRSLISSSIFSSSTFSSTFSSSESDESFLLLRIKGIDEPRLTNDENEEKLASFDFTDLESSRSDCFSSTIRRLRLSNLMTILTTRSRARAFG